MNKSQHLAALMLLAAGSGLLAGCSPAKGDAAFLNKEIAGSYSQFYASGPSQPDVARDALKKALEGDPANAYTVYLQASHQAKQGNLDQALALMKQAEQMPKTVHYVASLPPDDPMQTLNRIRQFGFMARGMEDPPGEGTEFYDSLRVMGEKVASAEPVTSLGVICGSSVIRTALGSKAARLDKEKKAKEAVQAREDLKRFETWSDSLTEQLSAANKDIVREAGTAAGLTEAEMADFSRGVPLKDSSKQQKADEARLKLYDAEIAVLREALAKLPSARQKASPSGG
jgi:tetratricopeptide (TPR) repeat protein